jgi:hypothetical protein
MHKPHMVAAAVAVAVRDTKAAAVAEHMFLVTRMDLRLRVLQVKAAPFLIHRIYGD